MEWKSIEKDGLPEYDKICLVCNINNPFRFYIANYQFHSKLFKIWEMGFTRLYDGIPFHTTHYFVIDLVKDEK